MKSPCGILWKGVLEPLTHLCTDLKISEESKGEGVKSKGKESRVNYLLCEEMIVFIFGLQE